jgi:hypothetical protein
METLSEILIPGFPSVLLKDTIFSLIDFSAILFKYKTINSAIASRLRLFSLMA